MFKIYTNDITIKFINFYGNFFLSCLQEHKLQLNSLRERKDISIKKHANFIDKLSI